MDLFTHYPWLSAALLYIFATAVHFMPAPLPSERWYGWIYNVLQAIAANWANTGKKSVL